MRRGCEPVCQAPHAVVLSTYWHAMPRARSISILAAFLPCCGSDLAVQPLNGSQPLADAAWIEAGDDPVSGDSDLPDAAGGTGWDGGSDAIPSDLRVLFIGNSYTYVNELPQVLAAVAATSGAGPAITVDEVVRGGATLQDHWNDGIAQSRITSEPWTHVVLQGQSLEAASAHDETFASAAEQFANLIVAAGSRPVLFVTWARAPGSDTYFDWFGPTAMQDIITFNYADAGRKVPTSDLSCVGEAFRTSLRLYPGIVLHQSDGSHPTIAGTYLAASTHYVALTGSPVPAHSAVPSDLSPEDAAMLRDAALVGSDCWDIHPKGALVFDDCVLGSCEPFDFGVAGTPIPHVFEVSNHGFDTLHMEDALTLQSPFAWTSGTFPGGSGVVQGTAISYCSSTLAPATYCALSVSYLGSTTGSGQLSVTASNAYQDIVSRDLLGASTTRALLTVSPNPGLCNDGPLACVNPCNLVMWKPPEGSSPLTLVVTNRGALPTTSLGVGMELTPPFYWGLDDPGAAFPGGIGTGQVGGTMFDYCSMQVLAPGQQCIVSLSLFSDSQVHPESAVDLAYSDAHGPLSGAVCDVVGNGGGVDLMLAVAPH